MRALHSWRGPLGILALAGSPLPAGAQAVGSEFQVNTYTTDNQQIVPFGGHVVAADASGNFVVVWRSLDQDGSSHGIFAQRYDSAGEPLGGEFRVNSFTTNRQMYPSVAAAADGDFVVVWDSLSQDGSSYGIFGQRYDADGDAKGNEFRINSFTNSHQKFPSVASDTSGNFVVVWNSYTQDGDRYGIFGQRYDSEGVKQGGEFRVNSYTTLNQRFPSVASDASGNFVVVWSSYTQDGGGYGIFAQRYDADGDAKGNEFRVNSFTTSQQRFASVSSDTSGNFVVVWNSFTQDGSDYGIFGQRYDSAGVAQGGEFRANSFTTSQQRWPSVVSDTSGNFVVAWHSKLQDGSDYAVVGRHFNSAGVPQGGEFQINTHTTGYQLFPSVGATGTNQFVVVWESFVQDGSGWGVFGQRFEYGPLPELSVGDVTLSEGNSGSQNAMFAITLDTPSGQTVSVAYATADDTAVAPGDYSSRSGTATFAPGDTAVIVSVPVTGDQLVEDDETFFLELSSPVNATLGDAQGEATILNDDLPGILEFSAPGYNVTEKQASATIQVRRSGGMAGGVEVSYRTADASATAGADYTATSGTLSFGVGVTMRTFTVPILKDSLIEGSEGVLLALQDPTGGAVLGPQSTAMLTITDDDLPGNLRFSAASYSVKEALTTATVTVTRTRGGGGPVSVNYATGGGTATPGSDYLALAGVLTFQAGETRKTFSLTLLPDAEDELNETVGLSLSDPTNGAKLISPSSATLTILDDDQAGSVQFAISGYTENEGSASAQLTLTRSGGSAGPVTVDFQSSDGSAKAGFDYQATAQTVTFAAGVMSQTVTLPILPDGLIEGPETVNLTLSNPTGGLQLGARKAAVLTIVDDEVAVTLHFSAPVYSVSESKSATLTVQRSGSTAAALTVDYQTSDGTAQAGPDYTAASGTLSFGVGVASRTFKVATISDTLDEADEELNLTLSNPTGGAVLGTQATAKLQILDNDSGGVLQFSAASYSRSESSATATITVKRTGGLASGVGVSYASSDGSAEAGSDYQAVSGVLSFGAGQKSSSFTVPILADSLDEGAGETVLLQISAPTGGATLGSLRTATLTLVDDDKDGAFEFSVSSYAVGEAASPAQVTVTRNGGVAGPVTVDYQTSDGTAQAGGDYAAAAGTLTFAPGVKSQTFAVTIVNDSTAEGSETVNLALLNPGGQGQLGARSMAILTILDDETVTTLHFDLPEYTASEGKPGVAKVVRSGSVAGAVTVDYQTSDGTAQAGSDYVAKSGTLSFKAGQTSLSFSVTTSGDTLDETDENLTLTLSNPTGGAVLGTQDVATLVIADDDTGGALQFSSASYSRSESLPTATITVTRVGGLASGVTVHYASIPEVGPGKATSGVDYAPVSGDLAFAAGQKSRTFTVSILPDSLDEDDETLTLELSDPQGGATLGNPSTTTLTIVEDDVAGTLQFGEIAVAVGESSGTAIITVTRSSGSASGVTVNYATSNGTATAGSDYQAANGTLIFSAGETSKTFNVTILPDGSDEANETVNLTLSAPGGGGGLGNPSKATLYIVDDD